MYKSLEQVIDMETSRRLPAIVLLDSELWKALMPEGVSHLWVPYERLDLHNDHLRRRQWHPTPVLLPGKSHGWSSLVGCSPWGRWESGTTERLPFHFSLSCIGEGNGNPLQCSCLENPRDGGAWWAAVYGVTHNWSNLAAVEFLPLNLIN